MTIIKKGSIITMKMKENAQGNEIEKMTFSFIKFHQSLIQFVSKIYDME